MSIVNQMLRELDQRHAIDAPGEELAAKARPTRPVAVGSEWFWRVLAFVMLVALGWVGWVVWQLVPRSNVTELALKSAALPRVSSPVAVPSAVQAPAPAQGAPTAAAAMPVPAVAPGAAPARPDMLLAREIVTPIRERKPRAAPTSTSPERSLAGEPVAARELQALAAKTASAEPPLAAASGRIERRDSNTPRERAEAEFRRALVFVNQGRMAEGMEAFRAALTLDPGYETARQTQISLLLEAQRVDEAQVSLQEALELNPANTSFVTLLARIMVQKNDLKGALSLLQKHSAASGNNPDYIAFVAALQQRLGQHREATAQYQQALKLVPQAGPWWVGLGISLESLQRDSDAAQAFRKAKESGSLNAELASYVNERLKALP